MTILVTSRDHLAAPPSQSRRQRATTLRFRFCTDHEWVSSKLFCFFHWWYINPDLKSPTTWDWFEIQSSPLHLALEPLWPRCGHASDGLRGHALVPSTRAPVGFHPLWQGALKGSKAGDSPFFFFFNSYILGTCNILDYSEYIYSILSKTDCTWYMVRISYAVIINICTIWVTLDPESASYYRMWTFGPLAVSWVRRPRSCGPWKKHPQKTLLSLLGVGKS